ncbi:hypothetical protein BAVI_15486 [Neobacillus vireti LMG 21834]|uniref:Pullulanase n=1 Tax=Neobacillus vireti LMG 21834 TaxID=1131730 RepID=A0AB94ILJ8_9BACI|nr:hypothetical protein BAVI_15486 [Neobacillus vireti LMG 21834]KLT17325.1 pullulanase [Neobacillus vireti]
MNITGYLVDKLEDPFGLLSGDRYEFFLDLDVDEEDELYSEKGVGLKIIFVSDENGQRLSQYHFFEKGTEKVLDFALEEDEEKLVLQFCKEHLEE